MRLQLVATTGSDLRAYVAANSAKNGICTVYRLEDGASLGTLTSTPIFTLTPINDNIATGWVGSSDNAAPLANAAKNYKPDPGREAFINNSPPTGLAVAIDLTDPLKRRTIVVVSDTASLHRGVDDPPEPPEPGEDPPLSPPVEWQQIYLRPDGPHGSNPAGATIKAGKAYEGSGLQCTVCTWMDALPRSGSRNPFSPRLLRVSGNDFGTIVSGDGGVSWSFASEHWETPPGFKKGSGSTPDDPFPGDIAQTVHYVDANQVVHEFGIRFHLAGKLDSPSGDMTVNTAYSTVETLVDTNVDQWTGAVHKRVEVPSGVGVESKVVWKHIKSNFGDGPIDVDVGVPVWMTIDEKLERLYVAVAHSKVGGVWYCDDPIPNITATSTWTLIRGTGPHPFNIRLLSGGDRLLVSQSGNLSLADPNDTKSEITDHETSGVFVFRRRVTFGQETWSVDDVDDNGSPIVRTNEPEMKSWTQDVILDPADPEQRWYACVWNVSRKRKKEDQNSIAFDARLGGLYQTIDGGESWSRLFPPDAEIDGMSITSCAMRPNPGSREMFVCTRYDGLYYCANINQARPTFELTSYPFRAPMRVFYVEDAVGLDHQVWVTSNGYGLCRLVRTDDGFGIQIDLGLGSWARIASDTLGGRGRALLGGPPAAATIDTREVGEIVEQIVSAISTDLRDDSAVSKVREALHAEVERRLLFVKGGEK